MTYNDLTLWMRFVTVRYIGVKVEFAFAIMSFFLCQFMEAGSVCDIMLSSRVAIIKKLLAIFIVLNVSKCI